jgi:hypothetical protein
VHILALAKRLCVCVCVCGCVCIEVCNELYLVHSRHSILVESLNHILAAAFAERQHASLQSVPEPLGDLSGPVLFPCTHAHTSTYTHEHATSIVF